MSRSKIIHKEYCNKKDCGFNCQGSCITEPEVTKKKCLSYFKKSKKGGI